MNEMNVFRIEDNRTSPPTVKEYEVVDGAAREDISELKADFLQSLIYDTASGSVATFADGAHDLLCKSVVAQIVPKQAGSGDPSPDNVRPISGWDAVTVEHAGKNLASVNVVSNVKKTNGYPGNYTLSFADDKITATVTGSGANWFTYKFLHVTPQLVGKTVFVTWDALPAYTDRWMYLFDPTTSNGSTIYTDHTTITAEMIGKDLCFFFKVYSVGTHVISNIQAEFGSTATTYEPYTGSTYSVNLPQTVYGGQVDVVSGEGKVTYGMVDLGTLTWVRTNSDHSNYYSTGMSPYKWANDTQMMCSKYAFDGPGSSTTGGYYPSADKAFRYYYYGTTPAYELYIHDTSTYADAAAFKASLSGVYLVYELPAPTDFTVTPQTVPTLYGSNTVYADSGDVAVEYPADTKLYISRLTEPDSEDMIADANIVSGKYFMVGNDLYLATANIANGGAIVPGTNCTKVSLATALNAINS